MENQINPIYAVFETHKNIIIGKVLSINDNELVIQSFSDGTIPIGSSQQLDVFAKGQVYSKKLPVQIISDDKFIDEESFSKMLARNVKVRYRNGELFKKIQISNRFCDSKAYPMA